MFCDNLFLMKLKKHHLILISILSGVILTLAWPVKGFPGLLFIGLVPLLFIEDYISNHRDKFLRFSLLFYSYPAFFTWNLLTTWWIYNSTLGGAIMAVVLNSLFLAIVFQVFSWAKSKLSSKFAGYLALVSFWIAFEYLHLNWILTWPWLILGNGFASYYNWVQWYEYTGVMGGTLWVLVSNILIFEGIRNAKREPERSGARQSQTRNALILLISTILLIAVPIIISFSIYRNYSEKADPVNFVVVQPNVDPYNEQYSLPPSEIVNRIMALADPLLDSNTNFLVAPESAIQEDMWENDENTFVTLNLLRSTISQYPDLNILIGGGTYRVFEEGEPLSTTARKFRNSEGYYDAFNTAILINASDSMQLYHKSKLTPGVEALPSLKGFGWLEEFALDLGGTVGSLGTDAHRKVYWTNETVRVSPIIMHLHDHLRC